MDFEFYFSEQLRMHPAMQYQDAVKLCYQASFGAEHLLSNIERARAYLYAEFDNVSPTDEPLFEQISPDFVRVNLGAWKREDLPISALFEVFKSTAFIKENAKEAFISYVEAAGEIMERKLPTFSREEWLAFIEEYKALGMPAIHHSEDYRANENPHYRVVAYKCFTYR